jgi:hypothetical protein
LGNDIRLIVLQKLEVIFKASKRRQTWFPQFLENWKIEIFGKLENTNNWKIEEVVEFGKLDILEK